MVEDDDDKVRRNLVVMSTAILLVAFLDVPVQSMLSKGVSADWQPSLARGWLAAFVVLFYMAMRFRFHPASSNAFGEVHTFHRDLLRRIVSTRWDATTRDSSGWWAIAGVSALNELVAQREQPPHPLFPDDYHRKPVVISDLTGEFDAVEIKNWRTAIAVTEWTHREQSSWKTRVRVQLPWTAAQAISANLRAGYRSWFYSKEAVTLLAPTGLALSAGAVASYKAASHWVAG